jgi:hypothetical protein
VGNGLGIKEKDLHGLSGSGVRSEIILAITQQVPGYPQGTL